MANAIINVGHNIYRVKVSVGALNILFLLFVQCKLILLFTNRLK